MCFRPAEVQMNVCPECGKANKPIAKVCEQCGAALEMKKVDFDADQGKLDSAARNAPGAPKPPSPPSGVPKPPSTPKSPS